jgi:hypothetical protein
MPTEAMMTMYDSWTMRREVQRVWVIMVERLHPECQCPARCLLPERCLIWPDWAIVA